MRDIYVAVLRKREPYHCAFRFGKIGFARYHAVVGAEEAVDGVNRHVLDCGDEGRQVEGNGKALAVPHVGGTGEPAYYLPYIYI